MKTLSTIVIISSRHKSRDVQELSRVAKAHGWRTILTMPDADNVQSILDGAERVIFRISPKNYPIYVSLLAKISGAFHDQLSNALKAFDKIETNNVFAESNIPTPRTWVIKSGESFGRELFVIKIRRGNQGLGVSLIEDDEALQAFFAEYPLETEFLAQEFIGEAQSKDKRMLVVGDRVVASMRRQSSTNDFRANIHLGGEASVYTPTNEEETLAIMSVKAFGLEYAGVDIIDSAHGPLLLEVNPSPGFSIATISGIDVAETVFNYITKEP
jgi:ribosomal protein S6--L-glutamate ligase